MIFLNLIYRVLRWGSSDSTPPATPRVIPMTGSYVIAQALTGSYAISPAMTGSYVPSPAMTGSVSDG